MLLRARRRLKQLVTAFGSRHVMSRLRSPGFTFQERNSGWAWHVMRCLFFLFGAEGGLSGGHAGAKLS
jgi:hypothetical protein